VHAWRDTSTSQDILPKITEEVSLPFQSREFSFRQQSTSLPGMSTFWRRAGAGQMSKAFAKCYSKLAAVVARLR